MKKIGFIGAGNMGGAIIKGIAHSELREKIEIYAADTDPAKLDAFSPNDIIKCKNAQEVTDSCEIVFLAVKPQSLDATLGSIKEYVRDDQIFVSIAAGITADFIRKALDNQKVGVILVMPNTPLLLGEGATAIAANNTVPESQFKFICDVFENCGKIQVISENKMKEVIAVNSSSPAFIYLFSKGFIDYADKAGIPADAAKELFSQALIGSAKMMTDSGYSIDELIKMVSSPGGTTLAGLDKLYENNILKAVDEACTACTDRAYELSK